MDALPVPRIGAASAAPLGGSLLAEAGVGATLAVTAGSNVVGGAVTRELDSDPTSSATDVKAIAVDAAVGAAGGVIGEGVKRAVVGSQVLTQSGRETVSSVGRAEKSLLQPFVMTTTGIRSAESVAGNVDAIATVAGAKTANVAYPAAQALVEKRKEDEEQ